MSKSHHDTKRAKIRAKIRGTKDCPRLVVFRSLQATYAQLINDEVGETLCASSDLKNKKGKRSERAQQIGEALAKQALALKIEKVRFDRAGYKYHGLVKAVAEGARAGGLKF